MAYARAAAFVGGANFVFVGGANFVKVLDEEIAAWDVLLTIIGRGYRGWTTKGHSASLTNLIFKSSVFARGNELARIRLKDRQEHASGHTAVRA
jgi:hypothetical protein